MGENCTSKAGVVALAVVCLALGALTASCGGGEEAETPASPTTATPVVTASPSPTPAVTPVPTATPSPTPAPGPDADEPPPDGTTPVPTATPSEAPAAATPSPTATATPSPTPAATPAIEYTELTLGEPRYQPAGYALWSSLRGCFWNCDGGNVGVVRTVFDERSGTLLVENPLEPLEDPGFYYSFGMSDSGRLMATAFCLVGYCGGISEPSDDAEEELWVSGDGGRTWTSWGALLPSSRILRVTDEDVAVLEWAEVNSRVRWLRSGRLFAEPDDTSGWVSGWDGDTPVWGVPGVQIAPPALTELVGWTWLELQPLPDGAAVWYATEVGEPLLLLAVVDAQGAVEDVYGWPRADYVGPLVPVGDGVFVGFRIEGGYALGIDHLNFLIDLTARSVHPLLGLPDEGRWAEPWRAIPLTTE